MQSVHRTLLSQHSKLVSSMFRILLNLDTESESCRCNSGVTAFLSSAHEKTHIKHYGCAAIANDSERVTYVPAQP